MINFDDQIIDRNLKHPNRGGDFYGVWCGCTYSAGGETLGEAIDRILEMTGRMGEIEMTFSDKNDEVILGTAYSDGRFVAVEDYVVDEDGNRID